MSSTDDLIDKFATLFANYYECSKPLAKSAYLVARTNPVNNALPMQLRAQEIKSRIGLLIYYYKMYIIAKRISPELTNTQRDDIMRHINKVINDSPLGKHIRPNVTKIIGTSNTANRWKKRWPQMVNEIQTKHQLQHPSWILTTSVLQIRTTQNSKKMILIKKHFS